MSRLRSIRHRGQKKVAEDKDLVITSLLDILTTILLFLVVDTSLSGDVIPILPDIKIPTSLAQNHTGPAVTVQVSKSQIYVEDLNVVNYEKLQKDNILYDLGGRRIVPLYNELVRLKDEVNSVKKQVPDAQEFSGLINLVVDESLTYETIKRILFTAAEAGYKEYKFIVATAKK
jgi:biopolymer transport protein ExbD